MPASIRLPQADGTLGDYRTGPPGQWPATSPAAVSRQCFAAAHVVADPLADHAPGAPAALDWDATMAQRHHLWRLGLSVAEAMDTAQRGSGLDWSAARELIRRTAAEASACGGGLVCGAGTDHIAPHPDLTLAEVEAAYREQCEFVEGEGADVVLMCSRALAACARNAEDYAWLYGRVLASVSRPVILHWLGEAFDPALSGYWGSADPRRATETCLEVIRQNAAHVAGIKLSLLDAGQEVEMRLRLPAGVRMFTGDDFHYPELIAGDAKGGSDALLGILDGIAPAAAAALARLDAGDAGGFREALEPTLPLARHVFEAPTRWYKTGLVFIAYLAGRQAHFRMVGGQESARSALHLAGVFTHADRAGLLPDPDLACHRMRHVLALSGIDAA